jgi:3',5'-cyclic AMP phosphodiesterase CpdA
MSDHAAPTVLVQLSDPHLRTDDPSRQARFGAAIARVAAMSPQPAAVIVTGDLVDNAERESYDTAARLLAALTPPVYVIPGNHDDRAAMRAAFGLAGAPEDEIRFSFDAGPLRVVAADTVIPGAIGGRLDVAWVEEQLAAEPERPTVLALHHPAFLTGFVHMDGWAIDSADRAALAALLERSPQVLGVIAGHVHRSVSSSVGGTPAVIAPSTGLQLELNLVEDVAVVVEEPPGFLVHVLIDGQLVTHLQPV